MQRGTENYEGKEICILGGGDGALLYELLKEKPKFVVMLEIDEMVMQVCNKYLRSICGDVLELRKSDNFEVKWDILTSFLNMCIFGIYNLHFNSSDYRRRLYDSFGEIYQSGQKI